MDAGAATTTSSSDGSSGIYVLRELIKDIPLSSNENGNNAHITTVDAWNGNLYIGTSAGEVLHYVSIPPDPADPSGEASYIFATKLEPPFTTQQEGRDAGVKQILLLPDAGKACILCNGTLTFYVLPELSPAYGEKVKQSGCTWVGGLDLNLDEESGSDPVIVICLKGKMRLIRVGKDARNIRNIDLGGILAIQRRGDLACVADESTYALLDIVNHRKNDLFPISSLTSVGNEKALPELPPPGSSMTSTRGTSRSFSAASPSRHGLTHERNVSLGAEPTDSAHWPSRGSSRQMLSPARSPAREPSPANSEETPQAQPDTQARAEVSVKPLPPHIISPSPNEFLLTTGTRVGEPGVGVFVNGEGDPSGGTIEFTSYPESIVLDAAAEQNAAPETPGAPGTARHVLAIVQKKLADGNLQIAVEIQRLDSDAGEAPSAKQWLPFNTTAGHESEDEVGHAGLRVATTSSELPVSEISTCLRLRRLILKSETKESDAKRDAEEDKFASRFSQVRASALLFTHDQVSWVTRNPAIVQLERKLGLAVQRSSTNELSVHVPGVQNVINTIRGQEARDELEFLTLTYVRQKASLLLFGNLILQTALGNVAYERDKRFAEEALVAGDIDPRVILSLVLPLIDEVQEGEQGIWISQGLRDTISMLRDSFDATSLNQNPEGAYGDNLLAILKRYLFTWRKKKGFGSVADETLVFQTVDAALIYILLLLDQKGPRGPAIPGSVRAELNELVDGGVDCFDRAVQLFEQFKRLYMLSRLYQRRKMIAQVLATWKRILEGERDAGGELIEGDHDLRRYLVKIRDQALVEEYGAWLAHRNPKLGVQVFADENSRVTFQPSEAVAILKEKAPNAVKDYLEHLVFDKNHVQYVNDLIAFYLDTVLQELESSDEAKQTLLQSYSTYRALRPPKPTYRHFITDNAINAEWWHNRLRLLQLIGGSRGAASKYDVHALRERLAPYSDELVPEMIILNGREGKHEEALRLLTHGLGDFDTAIRYCLLSGSSIFHPSSGITPPEHLPTKEEQAQLFEYLLHEFFKIEDLSEQLERTAELLERFGAWFDIRQVLELIPESWSVELVRGFLVQALRALVRERNETVVVRALVGAQNLRRSAQVVEKIESLGPLVVTSDTAIDVT